MVWIGGPEIRELVESFPQIHCQCMKAAFMATEVNLFEDPGNWNDLAERISKNVVVNR